jgi:glycosyltransferase involved in cell wall biosynthesis
MKIGIDIRAIGYQRTGDETYTLQLIKSLMKKDSGNEYFLYTDIVDSDKLQKVKKLLDIEVGNFKIIPVSPVGKIFWTMYSLPRQAKKDNLDILHVQYITPLFLSRKIKLITTIHDISFARYPKFISKKDLFILRLFIKPSLNRADRIIAISKFTKDEIEEVYNINSAKIKMIYNGGVAKEFKQKIAREDVLKFRKRYDIIKPYILFLGTLQPRKNIVFLIKAFVALKVKNNKQNRNITELELVLRGKRNGHNYDKRIDKLLSSIEEKYPDIHKQIKFIDYVSNEEIPLIFKGAKVFSFTSVYEGFGLPLLESMTVGVPVLASDESCFPEIINEAGLLYKSGNYSDWIKKITMLIDDEELYAGLIKKGLEQAKKFTWENNARQTVQLYTELNKK